MEIMYKVNQLFIQETLSRIVIYYFLCTIGILNIVDMYMSESRKKFRIDKIYDYSCYVQLLKY